MGHELERVAPSAKLHPGSAVRASASTGRVDRFLVLQNSAGNRAVATLIARQVDGADEGVIRPDGEYRISESRYRSLIGDGTTVELRAAYEWLHLQLSPSLEPIADSAMWVERLARLTTYIAERGDSALPDSAVSIVFDGRTLALGTQSWPAVSGLADATGRFDYSLKRQRDQGVGPIPAGEYWVDPSQLVDLRGRWFYSLRYEASWGTHRVTIHPFDSTRTFGRGGFFIHGGDTAGSKGCIDLTSRMEGFAEAASMTPRGQTIRLLVQYS